MVHLGGESKGLKSQYMVYEEFFFTVIREGIKCKGRANIINEMGEEKQ